MYLAGSGIWKNKHEPLGKCPAPALPAAFLCSPHTCGRETGRLCFVLWSVCSRVEVEGGASLQILASPFNALKNPSFLFGL